MILPVKAMSTRSSWVACQVSTILTINIEDATQLGRDARRSGDEWCHCAFCSALVRGSGIYIAGGEANNIFAFGILKIAMAISNELAKRCKGVECDQVMNLSMEYQKFCS